MKVKLSQIRVRPKHDQAFTTREIEGMVDSMEMNELVKPIMVTHDLFIISGYRRYQVAKFLGWEEIEVTFGNREREDVEYTDIRSAMPHRKKSTEVLSEIQQLYQNYTKPQGTGKEQPGSKQNQNDNSRHIESWYW